MLPGMVLRITEDSRFENAARRIGLTPELCYDVGDVRSYPGSGQSLFDISGNAYHSILGATSGSEASDPTPTGGAGNPAAYLALDGGDTVRINGANPAFIDDLHKNNAHFWSLFWASIASMTSSAIWGSQSGSDASVRLFISASGGNRVGFSQQTDTGAGGFGYDGTFNVFTPTLNTPTLFSVYVDEAAGSGYLGIDTLFETMSPTYVTPGTAAAQPFVLGARGLGMTPLSSGSRLYGGLWGNGSMKQAQVAIFREATRHRFGV